MIVIPPGLRVIPTYLFPAKPLVFTSATVVPGVYLQPFKGRLANGVTSATKTLPISPGFHPTHMIVIDNAEYSSALDKRLKAEALTRHPSDPGLIEYSSIIRQVLICLSLIAGVGWTFGGAYSFKSRVSAEYLGYYNRETVYMARLAHMALAPRLTQPITAQRLRATASQLDRYYRSGVWWNDRLSTALGYLWSSLTSHSGELAFIALNMAQEALVSTSKTEVTHSVAERCAILARRAGAARIEIYHELKRLYDMRSKIVHGSASMKKGTITQRSLYVSAKKSNIPPDDLSLLMMVTLDVIEGVLASPSLLKILQTHQSENKTDEELNAYFLARLLHGGPS